MYNYYLLIFKRREVSLKYAEVGQGYRSAAQHLLVKHRVMSSIPGAQTTKTKTEVKAVDGILKKVFIQLQIQNQKCNRLCRI